MTSSSIPDDLGAEAELKSMFADVSKARFSAARKAP